MSRRTRGLIVALLHIVLVSSLGAKLLIERNTLPRAWAEVVPYDPDLPIRGRYVRLRLVASPRGFAEPEDGSGVGFARLSVENGELIATRVEGHSRHRVRTRLRDGELTGTLATPVAFFIPEHVEDPSRRSGLMVEVTVPKKGPPRPIRLGVMEEDVITPLVF
jgi:hypothetical protein